MVFTEIISSTWAMTRLYTINEDCITAANINIIKINTTTDASVK